MPKESTRGEQVWNPVLEGQYAVGRVVRMSEWVKDWTKWFFDNPSVDLQDY